MRLLSIISVSSVIAAYCNAVVATLEIQKQKKASTFELFDNFRTPKNVMFSCTYGGSSHVVWVLAILEELADRGHSTFFLTTDEHLKFTKNHPRVNTTSIGSGSDNDIEENTIKNIRSMNIAHIIKGLMKSRVERFEIEYVNNKDSITSNRIDVVICDHFGSACHEAALEAGIPFIVSATYPQGPDASAPYINNDVTSMMTPTTENLSLAARLLNMIKPIHLLYVIRENLKREREVLKSLNLKPAWGPFQKWQDSVKIVNSAFGFEPGRPLGPLTEFIGPIIPRQYPALTDQLESFLSAHSKVAYIAFGQHAVASESDGRLVLTALLESIESGDLDGIIWATRGIADMFPKYITTSSSREYNITSFSDNRNALSNVLFLSWAPQMAILQHPSTVLFVTHGGAGSLYESMFAGVRVVVYPFFGDQFSAAAIAEERNGVGLKLDSKKSQRNANEVIQRVARDEDGTMQANTDRFKALVQIRSKHGAMRGADIVEEVVFMKKENGKIPHRHDANRNMSFFKANNYDIYAILFLSVGIIGYKVISILYHFIVPKNQSLVSRKRKFKSL